MTSSPTVGSDLPHLSESLPVLYKDQIAERVAELLAVGRSRQAVIVECQTLVRHGRIKVRALTWDTDCRRYRIEVVSEPASREDAAPVWQPTPDVSHLTAPATSAEGTATTLNTPTSPAPSQPSSTTTIARCLTEEQFWPVDPQHPRTAGHGHRIDVFCPDAVLSQTIEPNDMAGVLFQLHPMACDLGEAELQVDVLGTGGKVDYAWTQDACSQADIAIGSHYKPPEE